MLFFGDKDSPALSQFKSGFRAKLEQELNAPVWIYDESFDEGQTGRTASYEASMENSLREKYAQRGIDMVLPVGDAPLQFLLSRRKVLLPQAKLVYFTFGSAPAQRVPNATGLAWNLGLGPTLDLALQQNPGTRHVLLIAGATATDRALTQLLLPDGRESLEMKRRGVDLQILAPGTYAETLSTLSKLPQDTISVFVFYYGDSAGQAFIPARTLSKLSEASNRPMYSWLDTFLGRGIVGGSLASSEEGGAALAMLASRVLRGENPGDIPVATVQSSHDEFDWRQMKRWGISLDTIPVGSTVIHREYSIWELYKWQILGIVVLSIFEALLILALIRLTIDQRRNLKQFAFRNELESLVAKFAATFINLPAESVTDELDQAFQRMLEFFDLDQISLFEFSAAPPQLRLLSSRSTAHVQQPPPIVELHQLPWTTSQMLRGAPVVASSLDDLPQDATGLKELMRARGVQSLIVIPLQRAGVTFESLTFSTVHNQRKWEPEVIQSLQTVSSIVGSALYRKYAEEAAQQSSTRLSGIIESAMDAIIVVDSHQRILIFNAAAERIFACPAEETLGQTFERFIPERFRTQHHGHLTHFAAAGVTSRAMGPLLPLWALRSNGEEFPIEASISQADENGNKLFTVIIRDITDRRKSEQALLQSEQLKTSILESLTNYVVVLDGEGFVVAVNNPEFQFAASNPFRGLTIGMSYFQECQAKLERGDTSAKATLEGIQAVFDGQRDSLHVEYAPDSAPESICFLVSVTPLKGPRGIVISLQDMTERKRHERAIQELTGRSINAQEQERSRIARELHDDVNQQLAVLAIELQQLEALFPGDSTESTKGRDRVQSLWKKTHDLSMDVQHLSHRLHSAKLEHLGIVAALRGLSEEFATQHSIACDFQFRDVPATIATDPSLSLFRVAQEGLHNIAKHSKASEVLLELVGEGETAVLRLTDNGVGFDPDLSINQSGLGMVSMRERIRGVGGTFSIRSKPSIGTRIEVVIPVHCNVPARSSTLETFFVVEESSRVKRSPAKSPSQTI